MYGVLQFLWGQQQGKVCVGKFFNAFSASQLISGFVNGQLSQIIYLNIEIN